MILSAPLITRQAEGKPNLPDPATDRLKPAKEDLQRLKGLFHLATSRETKETSVAEGWTGRRVMMKKIVPTENANESYAQAMRLAKRIIDESEDPGLLSELRAMLNANPMQDIFNQDPRYRNQIPPLVEDVAARLALIASKAPGG